MPRSDVDWVRASWVAVVVDFSTSSSELAVANFVSEWSVPMVVEVAVAVVSMVTLVMQHLSWKVQSDLFV